MLQLFLSPNVTIFRSGESIILRTPTLVLNFFEPKMSQVLCDVAAALVNGIDERFLSHSFAAKHTSAEVNKIVELLKRYQLVSNTLTEPLSENVSSQVDFLSFDGFLAEDLKSLQQKCSQGFVVDTSITSEIKLFEKVIAQPQSENIPVFVFSSYRKDIFNKLNKEFLAQNKPWILAFQFLEDFFLMSFRGIDSSCFECLPALSMSGRNVDYISVSSASLWSPEAKATAAAFLLREAKASCAPESLAHLHIARICPSSGELSRVRRLRSSMCPACASRSAL